MEKDHKNSSVPKKYVQHTINHAVLYQKQKNGDKGKDGLKWWQLSLIGIGSIIGAGFFLGTGVSISIAGPSVIAGYLLGGLIASLVFGALAEMSVNDPQKGSFRVYARKAFGKRMGFISGWLYWVAGILIMTSELTALAVFTRFWLSTTPLWLLSLIYAAFGLAINLLGSKGFGRIESYFGLLKMSFLSVFILLGISLLIGLWPQTHLTTNAFLRGWSWGATGFTNFWAALIIMLFSFGGIEVVGIASSELENKQDTPKAGIGLMVSLTLLYIAGLYFVLSMAGWVNISDGTSPFVTALSSFRIPYINSIINIIIVAAAFSTMVGALYAMSNILTSLSDEGLAPSLFRARDGKQTPSILFSIGSVTVLIIAGNFLPKGIYEYFSTAAGIALIVNWIVILSSHIRLGKEFHRGTLKFRMPGFPFTSYIGIILILFVISGALFRPIERMGLYLSCALFALVVIGYELAGKNTLTRQEEKLILTNASTFAPKNNSDIEEKHNKT